MFLPSSIQYFLYRVRYRYGRHLPLRVPVDVSLELASECNQRCSYCYHSNPDQLPFTKGVMSFETGMKIINQAADLGVSSIKMNFRGESTINPHFQKFTAAAKSLARGRTFIDRLTNSNFKFATSREDIFEGLCNQTKVKVSFDSFISEVFEAQRTGGIYSLAINNIDRFYHHEKRRDTELVIQAVRTKLNKDEDIAGQVKRRWPEANVSVRDMVEGRVEKDLSKFKNKERSKERKPCLQAFNRLIFDWQGIAQSCCPDIKSELKISSIHEMSLKDIFNHEKAKQLRRDLKSGVAFKNDPCKTCSSFESYAGYKPGWHA